MSTFHALVLAVMQGITELFPISSLGHAVIVPALFGWNIDQQADSYLPFLVVLHLGTATALLLYFWRDWWSMFLGVIGRGPREEQAAQRNMLLLLIVGTIPAGLIGVLLEKHLRNLFDAPRLAAMFLIVNGVILFVGERFRRRAAARATAQLTWKNALWIGIWQSAALIPGISRSGVTMVAGLVAGLKHADAARFSFLLATPIIFGAGVVELPKLGNGNSIVSTPVLIASGVLAGVAAFLSVAFLMRYFRRREFEALDPFAAYCAVFGAVSLFWLTFF